MSSLETKSYADPELPVQCRCLPKQTLLPTCLSLEYFVFMGVVLFLASLF